VNTLGQFLAAHVTPAIRSRNGQQYRCAVRHPVKQARPQLAPPLEHHIRIQYVRVFIQRMWRADVAKAAGYLPVPAFMSALSPAFGISPAVCRRSRQAKQHDQTTVSDP
jgi:hypothetical protein